MIRILFTGGTISMRPDPDAGGNVPAFKGEELVKRVAGLGEIAPIEVEDWGLFPAAHLDLGRLWSLRERVKELLLGPNPPTGIVITHGTDTMEETAYLLGRTLPRAQPIVLTGAMRNADHPGWDGADNLRNAVRVAATPAAKDRGAMVAFAGRIIDGCDAVKAETDELEAFEAGHGIPIGNVTDGKVAFTVSHPAARFALQPEALSARIALVAMTPGDDGGILEATFGKYDGLVLVGFGAGNIPPRAAAQVERWLEDGVPVVVASRCRHGETSASYAFEGGAAQLVAAGATLAGPRTPAQAWMEMTIALSAGRPYGK